MKIMLTEKVFLLCVCFLFCSGEMFGQRFQHSLGISTLVFNQRIQKFTYDPVDRAPYEVKAYPRVFRVYPTLSYKPRVALTELKIAGKTFGVDFSIPIHISAYGEFSTSSSSAVQRNPENYILLHIPAFLSLNYGASAFPNADAKKGFGVFAGIGGGYSYGKFSDFYTTYNFWSPNMNAGVRFQFSTWGIELAYTGSIFLPYQSDEVITWYIPEEHINRQTSIRSYFGSSQVQSIGITFYTNWTGNKKVPLPFPKFW